MSHQVLISQRFTIITYVVLGNRQTLKKLDISQLLIKLWWKLISSSEFHNVSAQESDIILPSLLQSIADTLTKMQHQTEAKSDPQRILDDASSILDDGSEESEYLTISSGTSRQTSVESDSSSQLSKMSNDSKDLRPKNNKLLPDSSDISVTSSEECDSSDSDSSDSEGSDGDSSEESFDDDSSSEKDSFDERKCPCCDPEILRLKRWVSFNNYYNYSLRRGPTGPSLLAPATQDKKHPCIIIK